MSKRRRGSRTGRAIGTRPQSRHRRFEDLVAEALGGIPMPFAAALDEVAIVIEDEPSQEQLRDSELGPDDTLYGLYEGVARTEYAADWIAVPNRISLFRLPLEADFADPDDARGGGPAHRDARAGTSPRHRRRASPRPRRRLAAPAARPGRPRPVAARPPPAAPRAGRPRHSRPRSRPRPARHRRSARDRRGRPPAPPRRRVRPPA